MDIPFNKMKLGFKALVGYYFDGESGIPVDFNLVREKGQKADKPFGMSNLNYSFLSFSKCQWVSNHWKELRNIS